MTIVEQTRVLRVLTETRNRLRKLQAVRLTDDIVTGEGLAEALEMLDDAIAIELRESQPAAAPTSS